LTNLAKKFANKNISVNFVSATDITDGNTIKKIKARRDMNTSNNVLTEAVYYILLALTKPLHGYGIMQQTAQLSNGRLVISAGTLYGAISTLLEKGWIEQVANVADSRRKEYIITAEGRAVLMAELDRLRELVANGEKIL
jgi:DNA-binding PadR family transcriptional regulator